MPQETARETSPAAGAGFARVLLESSLPQLDHLFDYLIPERLRGQVGPGMRVKVPLRSAERLSAGYVIDVVDSTEYADTAKTLDSVVSPIPVLSPEVWKLARAAADRAAGTASDVLRLAIPGRQVRVEKEFLSRAEARSSHSRSSVVQPSGAQSSSTTTAEAPAEPPQHTLSVPPQRPGLPLPRGARLAMSAPAHVARTSLGDTVGEWALFLAEAAAAELVLGRSSILVVPDYRDLDQLSDALRSMIPEDSIARLDAKQSNPDRYRAFLSCLEERPMVVLGNRSAIYAPVRELGLIGVWDDGDPLHTEQLAPYLNTRDVALLRQSQAQCTLLCVDISRSTDLQRLVEIGWVTELPAPKYQPSVLPTAMQAHDTGPGGAARIPSAAWTLARQGLDTGPVLIQVAKPGYAPVIACASCRTPGRCGRCAGPLALKSPQGPPSCSWCGALAARWRCTECQGEKLVAWGAGSGRTAEELGRAFPGVRVLISDGARPLLQVPDAPALVIATPGAEPLALGGYRAVLLLDGERLLFRDGLRVHEDVLRQWSHAVALSAPGARAALVGVTGPLAQTMATWRHRQFASGELAERRELSFPPAIRIATVEGRSQAVAEAIAAVKDLTPLPVLGPTDIDDGLVRAIVRFPFSAGEAVTAALRTRIIATATARRTGPGTSGRFVPRTPLRVRCDESADL